MAAVDDDADDMVAALVSLLLAAVAVGSAAVKRLLREASIAHENDRPVGEGVLVEDEGDEEEGMSVLTDRPSSSVEVSAALTPGESALDGVFFADVKEEEEEEERRSDSS